MIWARLPVAYPVLLMPFFTKPLPSVSYVHQWLALQIRAISMTLHDSLVTLMFYLCKKVMFGCSVRMAL